jgi:NAD(P)-dependent dehydrogenase (short-subunit alcohol dehydrogenase family)
MGATIVMVCRNREAGEKARLEIMNASGNKQVDLLIGDLSLQSSIRQLAKSIQEKYPKIDVLVNNAGLAFSSYQTTAEGIESTFAVNHLGYFLLTNLLMENIKAAPQGRVVNVASSTHAQAKINFDDIGQKNKYSLFGVYNQSKLCNVLFTYEMARRVKDTNVTVNCLNPGPVKTNLSRDMSAMFKFIGSLFFLTPEKASETAIYLASSPEIGIVNGRYFSKKKAIPSSKTSMDENLQKKLWNFSEELVKQKF